MEQITNQVTEKWNSLEKKQKIEIGVAAAAIIIAIAVIVFLTTRTQWRRLYESDLDAKSTAEVTAVLDDNNIKYNVINDGGNVEIDDKQFADAKMALSQAGVPQTEYTFTEAITNSLSTTKDEKTAKLNQLKKTDLQSTLKQMDGIEDARIELVVPQETNSFLQSQQESKASAVLTLSKNLTSKQSEGIATLIASSVQNLDVKNVVIMDTEGNTLYSGTEEGTGAASSKQQELKASAEEAIKAKVNDLLGGMYDDVRISPNLVLDFNQYQVTEENYTVQGSDESRGIVSQESTTSQSSTNEGTGEEPGVTTNGGDVPTYQVNGGSTSESKSNTKDIIYSPDKKVSTSVKNLGDVDLDKSSLAVHVYKNKIYREEDTDLQGMTWSEFKVAHSEKTALTVDDNVLSALKSATGLQDVVINAYENPIFLDQEAYQIDYKDYLPFILIVLIIIVIAIAIMRFRKHEEVVEVEPELEVEEMLKAAKEQVELEEIELKETLETKRQIDKFVDEKPEAVANLLRNWLTEEDWE